ncbi:MAG: hypothetical protein ABJB11_06040 [Ferruginibacter sp.]
MQKFSIPVSYELQPNADIRLAGFLFTCFGRLLQYQFVRNNALEFDLSNNPKTNGPVRGTKDDTIAVDYDAKELRLFIAPVTDGKIQQIKTIDDLDDFKPYEPVLRVNSDGVFDTLPIPGIISQFWPHCNCRVTGKISKWFHVGSTWEDQPICKARVHICDIDSIRYWIYKVPDFVIAEIPKIILQPNELIKFPIPIPDPPPFSLNNAALQAVQSANIFKTNSAENRQMEMAAKLPPLDMTIRQNFASGNLDLIRDTIVDNFTILHPWFCLSPGWWPYFYRCQELAVTYTDANGRFDVNVSYPCFGDKPDVYIWVEYLINGAWEIVYHPPIPCNIRWNYVCGTPINIHITDPRVPGNCCCNCNLPGELVWIRAIGSTSVSHINQFSVLQAPPLQSVTYDRIGLTDAGAIGDPWYLPTSVGDFKRPFGGSPSMYMGFGSSLPNSGIYYYRWSYKQVKNAQLANVVDSYKALDPINGIVNKGYQFEYTDSNGGTQSAPNSVKLGPFTVGANDNLYIIPPERPNMAPFNAPETSPDWHEPTDSMNTISFKSDLLKRGGMVGGDGLYEFKLELFDQAGNLITNVPKNTFKVPDYNNAGFSVNASDTYLENPTSTTASAFNMLVRIDNSQCDADVFTVNVNGAPASLDCCGFANYKPGGVEADLDLSFLATHPNNFAVFNFDVVKGTCGGVPIADANGMVIDSALGYILSGGIYDKHFTPFELLGACYLEGTGKAAFAETLNVAAMATDGVFRQSGKDAGTVAAFGLEP